MAGKAIIHIKLKSMELRSKLFSSYNYVESKFVLPGRKAMRKVMASRKESDGQPGPLCSLIKSAIQSHYPRGAASRAFTQAFRLQMSL